jgi:hypothetical protein
MASGVLAVFPCSFFGDLFRCPHGHGSPPLVDSSPVHLAAANRGLPFRRLAIEPGPGFRRDFVEGAMLLDQLLERWRIAPVQRFWKVATQGMIFPRGSRS